MHVSYYEVVKMASEICVLSRRHRGSACELSQRRREYAYEVSRRRQEGVWNM